MTVHGITFCVTHKQAMKSRQSLDCNMSETATMLEKCRCDLCYYTFTNSPEVNQLAQSHPVNKALGLIKGTALFTDL